MDTLELSGLELDSLTDDDPQLKDILPGKHSYEVMNIAIIILFFLENKNNRILME